MDFGNKLKALRVTNGVTLDELSKKLDVTSVTICRYEQGVYEPRITYLKQLADTFGVTLDFFTSEDREDYNIDLFVRVLALKLQKLGFDFENMSKEEKEGLADLLVTSIEQVFNSKKVVSKLKKKKSTD
ncbi:MAG: helix-turn-helix domain-containing protein [Sarcina sp.]